MIDITITDPDRCIDLTLSVEPRCDDAGRYVEPNRVRVTGGVVWFAQYGIDLDVASADELKWIHGVVSAVYRDEIDRAVMVEIQKMQEVA